MLKISGEHFSMPLQMKTHKLQLLAVIWREGHDNRKMFLQLSRQAALSAPPFIGVGKGFWLLDCGAAHWCFHCTAWLSGIQASWMSSIELATSCELESWLIYLFTRAFATVTSCASMLRQLTTEAHCSKPQHAVAKVRKQLQLLTDGMLQGAVCEQMFTLSKH